jgi:hypothetical protein
VSANRYVYQYTSTDSDDNEVYRTKEVTDEVAAADERILEENLLHEFGHPIPERPNSWYRKQARQKPIRDAIEQARVAAAQRRIYRAYKREFLANLEGQQIAEEARLLWWLAGRLAEDLVGLDYQER